MDLYFVFQKEQKKSCVPDFLATLDKYELANKEDYQKWLNRQQEEGNLEYLFTDIPDKEETVRDALKARIIESKDRDLAQMYPGKRNRNKRAAKRKDPDFLEAVVKEAEEQYLSLSVLEKEQIYEGLIMEWKARLLDDTLKDVKKELCQYNEYVRECVLKDIDFVGILEEDSGALKKEAQEIFDNFLKTEQQNVYRWVPLGSDRWYNSWNSRWQLDEVLSVENLDEYLEQFPTIYAEILADDLFGGYNCWNLVAGFMTDYLENQMNLSSDLIDELFDHYDSELYDFATSISDSIDQSEPHILAMLIQNPLYENLVAEHELKIREMEERKKRLEAGMLHAMPERYPDLYPLARKMQRHFILHIGPTNSGKTFEAIQRLKEAGAGIYLAPLRLLAFEQYERLNSEGIPCSLITGEEKEIVDGAKIQASTVEMLDTVREYPVTVIDEAQMISDLDRGWAWTQAILGACSKEIHVCAAPYAEGLIKRLIEECGDSYEIVRHERQTELVQDKQPYQYPMDVYKGDALIVFSKKNVHAVAYELQKKGIKCSIIYGNLPYDVRQSEAQKFASGKTDVLVATDAIGMGLNLPIQRTVFLEMSKYDGKRVRELYPEEIQQIAGRAGRRGMFEKGTYTCTGYLNAIIRKMEEKPHDITLAVIGFPEALITLDAQLSEIIMQWEKLPVKPGYRRMDTSTILQLTLELEGKTKNKRLIYEFATIPFCADGIEKTVWDAIVNKELNGKIFTIAEAETFHPLRNIQANLNTMEQAYKICDLLYNYFTRFDHVEEVKELLTLKKELSGKIMQELSEHKLQSKKCKYCGKVLPWNYPYGMCSNCHDERYGRHWYDDYDEDWF